MRDECSCFKDSNCVCFSSDDADDSASEVYKILHELRVEALRTGGCGFNFKGFPHLNLSMPGAEGHFSATSKCYQTKVFHSRSSSLHQGGEIYSSSACNSFSVRDRTRCTPRRSRIRNRSMKLNAETKAQKLLLPRI